MVQAWLRASSVIPLNVHLHQVLVLRRGPTAKFMPNSYVFPGGKLDALDAQFPRIMTNFDKGEDNQPIRLGLDSDFPLRVCAIREMFEESGLLPVVDGNCREKTILTVNEDLHLAEWRKKILIEPKLFPKLFSNSQKMDVDSLIPWANWLTPMGEYTKRYDTAFFILHTADSLKSTHCIKEMVDALWIEPSEIIAKSAKSEISLPPPQFYELLRIRLLNTTKSERFSQYANPMRITPHIIRIQESPELIVNLLPGDHLYDMTNPDFTPTTARSSKEVLPPYPDDPSLPIHRMIYSSHEPKLQYHKHELFVKNLEKLPQKVHIFHIDRMK